MLRRITFVALLLAVAVIVLRAPPPGDRRADVAPQSRPGDADAAVGWLMAVSVPALALLVYAALRYRVPRKPPGRPTDRRGHGFLAALAILAVLMTLSVLLAALSRVVGGRTDRSDRESGPGTPGQGGDGEPATPQPAPGRPAGDGPAVELWSVYVVAVLLLLLALSVVVHHRRPAPDAPSEVDLAGPGTRKRLLEHAASTALSALQSHADDPRSAVIRCYASFEQALREAPGAAPQAADTPSDVLDRATESGSIPTGAGRTLVELFGEARYSTHVMTEADRKAATAALRAILDDLREVVWSRT